jgi:glucans biosynthesis protein C
MARNAASADPPPVQPSNRLADMVQMTNGLNGARVLASILVVVFHAAIPYMISPVPLWIAHDTASHVTVDMLVFWINGFVMPLFFLLAGISIAKSAVQKPFLEFAWQRASRMGATFLLATILIMPILLLGWAIGLLLTERLTISSLSRLNLPETLRPYIGPGHLWFLLYLLILSVTWAAIARTASRSLRLSGIVQGKWAQRILTSGWAPLACALPTAALLAFDLGAPFRLISTFAPDISRLLNYFLFLVAGVWLANMPQACSALRTHALRHLVIASLVFIGLFPLTLAFFDNRLGEAGAWAMAGLQAVFTWSMLLGFIGGMIRWAGRPYESIRFGNEASFWIYLVHLPIVCIMQVVVLSWELNPWFKISIVSTVSLALSLLLYQYCVRYSFLGSVINGRRKVHATRKGWRLEAGWAGLTGFAAVALAAFLFSGWNLLCDNHFHSVVEGDVYRCNRPGKQELDDILAKHNIRTVISLAAGHPTEHWVQDQAAVCDKRQIRLVALSFREDLIPDRIQIRQLQQALQESPRPVLLVGGKRSPTLAGFASAVAVLMEDGSVEKAMEQFGLQYFQIEGPEKCIVAQPLRAYRQWLQANQFHHTAELFSHWAEHEQASADEMAAARAAQPEFEARMGAPRYPRRY